MPRKKPNHDFDLDSWLDAPTDKRRCGTCRSDPKVTEFIKRYIADADKKRKSGKKARSLPDFHDLLVRELRYPFTVESLRRHFRNCLNWEPPREYATTRGS